MQTTDKHRGNGRRGFNSASVLRVKSEQSIYPSGLLSAPGNLRLEWASRQPMATGLFIGAG